LLETWTEEDHRIADAALEKLGLSAFRDRWFSQLSGGEKQRVLIARALAQETRYIFLDESLSQLDINHQIEIMRMLKEIRK
jgi:iron complex transport system ATP-binding protein